jgi:hypothetical protein
MAFRFHQSLSGDNSKIAKCRCGVAGSAFPVDPTNPITSTSTRIPSCKPFAYVIPLRVVPRISFLNFCFAKEEQKLCPEPR